MVSGDEMVVIEGWARWMAGEGDDGRQGWPKPIGDLRQNNKLVVFSQWVFRP